MGKIQKYRAEPFRGIRDIISNHAFHIGAFVATGLSGTILTSTIILSKSERITFEKPISIINNRGELTPVSADPPVGFPGGAFELRGVLGFEIPKGNFLSFIECVGHASSGPKGHRFTIFGSDTQ